MIVLDTDHIVTLKYSGSDAFRNLARRMADSQDQDFVTTAVTFEEQLRGWLAQVNRKKDPVSQVPAYAELTGLIEFFSFWSILPFDQAAAEQFISFRKRKIRVGSMDLKIAAIAITNDALLLTANTRDFEMVPNLRIEDWIT